MRLHTLKSTVPRKNRKRVGRGNGNNWGRTCGRGEKGQMSRSGANHRPYFEGGQIPLLRRIPKRGFNNPNHKLYAVVNVGLLEGLFESGDTIDLAALQAKGLVKKVGAGLKVLGEGELSKSLTVRANRFSAAATAKVEAAGGTCETL